MSEPIEKILEEMVPRLRDELNGFGYSARTPDGDDLLQEIRIRLWKALKVRDGEIEFINSYAKKIVFSVFINEVNRIHRERQLISKAENQQRLECQGRGCAQESDEFLKEAVVQSLSALSRNKRLVIRLRLEGFTLAEIAQTNRWSLSKVRNSYYRGIQELKKRLSRRGICNED
jgi:RNA polymerase sigma factor (sigma-70 family)